MLLHLIFASLLLDCSSTAFHYGAINNKQVYSIKKLNLVGIAQFRAGFPAHAVVTESSAA